MKQAFTAPATSSGKKSRPAKTVTYPLSATTVDVYNAGYTAGLAANVSAGLVTAGFTKGQVTNNATTQSTTEVLYRSGAAAEANAARIAALFGVTAQASSSVSAGHVKVILGTSATLPSFSSLSPGSSAAARRARVPRARPVPPSPATATPAAPSRSAATPPTASPASTEAFPATAYAKEATAYAKELNKLPTLLKTASAQPFPKVQPGRPSSAAS